MCAIQPKFSIEVPTGWKCFWDNDNKMPGESPLGMMHAPPHRVRRTRTKRSRRWPIYLTLTLAVAAALAWACLWYYAAALADRTLAGWVEREAAAGRVYSCGSQSIGGFPLNIQARCTDASIQINTVQPPYSVQTKAVAFKAEVWRPTRLIGDFKGPLTLTQTGQSSGLTADWSRAMLIVSGVPPKPESVAIDLEAAHVRPLGGEAIFQATHAFLHGRLVGGTPNNHPVVDVVLHLAGALAPTLHAVLSEETSAEAEAVLKGFEDLAPKPWAARFREMHAAGGSIEIKSFRVEQANVIVIGRGTLTLNANGKLDGTVPVGIVGVDHLVPRLGIDRAIGRGLNQSSGGGSALDRLIPGLADALRESAATSLVDSLKKMGQPTTLEGQPAIVLPLRFADGAIYLGMLPLGEVPALF